MAWISSRYLTLSTATNANINFRNGAIEGCAPQQTVNTKTPQSIRYLSEKNTQRISQKHLCSHFGKSCRNKIFPWNNHLWFELPMSQPLFINSYKGCQAVNTHFTQSWLSINFSLITGPTNKLPWSELATKISATRCWR